MSALRRRRGNIVVLVAAGALLFLSMLGMVVDVGGWYGDRAQLQTAADVIAQVALRRHPDAPTGAEARRLGEQILAVNGLDVQRFDLRLLPAGGGLEVSLGMTRPRRFTRRKSRRSVDLVVQARAIRDGRGDIALLP